MIGRKRVPLFVAPFFPLLLLLGIPTLACAPEEGSERWCDQMRETPKSEWSAHETGVFTGKCAFR